MQDEELNLSPETLRKAIEAVKARAWDVNPFTVADELKVPRSVIYRHAEAMKLIMAARGGSFGMDVETSLDLTWQLRKLEQQNTELMKKLSSDKIKGQSTTKNNTVAEANKALAETKEKAVEIKRRPAEPNKKDDVIFNYANNEPYSDNCFAQLEELSWKDIETIYYFKVASFKDHVKNIFGNGDKSEGSNGDNTPSDSIATQSLSYGSITSAGRSDRQFSLSPFAKLKTSKTKIGQLADSLNLSQESTIEPAPESKQEPILGSKTEVQAAKSILEPQIENPLQEKPAETPTLFEEMQATIVQSSVGFPSSPTMKEDVDIHKLLASQIKAKLTPETQLTGEELTQLKRESKIYQKEEDSTSAVQFDWGKTAEPEIVVQTNIQFVESLPISNEMPPISNEGQANSVEAIPIFSEPIKLIPLVKAEKSVELPPIVFDQSSQNAENTGDVPIVDVEDTGDLKPIEIEAKVPDKQGQVANMIKAKDNTIGDELRDLIQSHIKNAAEQMAEGSHSIGTGKEFEVWLNNPARSKFVGSTKAQDQTNESAEESVEKTKSSNNTFKPKIVPPEVRKSCLILGVQMDNITYEQVQDAWKKAIAAPGVHPDQGGDTELAVYLNTAKDTLIRWLDAQAPKLGKKFGPFKDKEALPKKDKKKD